MADEQQNISTEAQQPTKVDDGEWINAMVKRTPRGFSIWIPAGAFK